MKNILYGDGGNSRLLESEPIPELVAQLSTEAINNDLLVALIENFHLFEFEVDILIGEKGRFTNIQ